MRIALGTQTIYAAAALLMMLAPGCGDELDARCRNLTKPTGERVVDVDGELSLANFFNSSDSFIGGNNISGKIFFADLCQGSECTATMTGIELNLGADTTVPLADSSKTISGGYLMSTGPAPVFFFANDRFRIASLDADVCLLGDTDDGQLGVFLSNPVPWEGFIDFATETFESSPTLADSDANSAALSLAGTLTAQ